MADLKAERDKLLKEIQRRGGRGKAPNYEKRLAEVEAEMRMGRGDAPKEESALPNVRMGRETDPRVIKSDEERADIISRETYGEGTLGRQEPVAQVDPLGEIGDMREVSTEDAGLSRNITDAEGRYAETAQRDAYVEDALKRMQGGLGGITAEENAALLDAGRRDLQSGEATAMRNLRGLAGASGVSGRSLGRMAGDVAGQRLQAQREMQTDLIARNVQEKARRLTDYSAAAGSASRDYNATRNEILNTLLGTRGVAADYRASGERANQQRDARMIEFGMSRDDQQFARDQYNINRSEDAERYNIGQREKEKAGEIGIRYGEIGLDMSRRAQDYANRYAKDTIDIAKRGVTGEEGDKKKKKKKKKKAA